MSFERAGHQTKHQPLWAIGFASSLTSVGLFVHNYLVEIEAVDEGPPDFTRCVGDELLFQHFLEGRDIETLKVPQKDILEVQPSVMHWSQGNDGALRRPCAPLPVAMTTAC